MTVSRPVHTPPTQTSVRVQAFRSPQGVLSGRGGYEQRPVAGTHVPGSWHWSGSGQVRLVPVQTPSWHVSPVVQRLPSLQPVSFGLGGFEHTPFAGSQVPASWH